MKTSTKAIEEIKNDPAASYWLRDQVSLIGKRDICDLIRDMAELKRIALLIHEEASREEEEEPIPDWLYMLNALKATTTTTTKPIWKVQLAACGGWADLKTSDDDGDGYFVEPMTYADAITHCKWMVDDLEHEYADLRIVSLDTPADCDLY